MGRNPLVRRLFPNRQIRRQRHARLELERLEERSLLSGDPTSLAPSLGPPPSPGPNVIWVNTQSALQRAFSNLQSGQTIVIQPGTYNLSSTLYIGLNSNITNVTVRGSTDNFNDVTLLGNGMDNSSYGNVPMGISIWNAQHVTIADLSIGDVYDDPIEIRGPSGASSVTIYHVHLFDAGEQFIKVDPPSSGVGTSNSAVEYSLIEYTNGPPTTDHGGGVGYTNGIDILDGQNWDIKSNLIRNLHTPDADSSNLWDPAILVWNNSSNVTTEGNTIINCDRAIAYGLIDQTSGYDNQGGIIRNNFIYQAPGLFSSSRAAASDGQIIVWDSPNSQVLFNSILTDGNSTNSIQLRWTTTGAVVDGNLADASIRVRDGATYSATGNYLSATPSMFTNPSTGDLHLVVNSGTLANVIDQATAEANDPNDWNGNSRTVGGPTDIGADDSQSSTKIVPTVTSESPSPNSTGVANTTALTATFNESVVASSITTSSFVLKDSNNNTVTATVSYTDSNHTATLTPSSPLSASTEYTATISGVTDAAGNVMVAPFSWSFTTAATVAPTVTSETPATSATGVATNSNVTATFNEAVKTSSITTSTFVLTGPSGSSVTATVAYNSSTNTATLTPTSLLANSTTYTATISGVTDAAGHTMASPFSWSFTTDSAPAVTTCSPAWNATGVAVSSPVTATFNEAVQSGTIGFTLTNPSGSTVAATVAYNSSTNTATLTPSAALAYSTTYTATVSGAKDSAGDLMTSPDTWTFTTVAAATPPPVTPPPVTPPPTIITTDYNNIPNFGSSPTVASVSNGSWSSASTWSTGQVPGAGAIVSIASGTTVTYDADSTVVLNTIVIQSGGTLQFATNINTEVIAAQYLVLQGGTLDVGTQASPINANVTAKILTADQPLNTTTDPSQYGDSLIGLGNVTIYGASKTPFGQLAVEPHAGNTTLTFSSPVTGWQPGDELYVPDTRQLTDSSGASPYGSTYVPEWEFLTIASISSNGLTVTLSSPLQYNHLGARDINGNLTFLPQVANETRNVVIASQNSLGNRGIVMFLQRANVNINSAAFLGLGRTTDNAIDNTTFNSSGQVTHIGTNEQDRTPVQFLDLWGPTTPQADGYQYTFNDNVVHCIMENQDHIWGIEINNSSYGLIQGNVVDNWNGAGIALVAGTEIDNMIQGNFVMQINGTGNRDQTGLDGLGYWSLSPDNSWVNNVATDINQGGIYSYGFDINAQYLANRNVPAYQGADPALPGQSTTINMNATPLLKFSGDEVYGATPDGLSLWWVGAFFDTPKGNAGTVEDFQFWNLYQWGYFGYETNNLVIDHVVGRGDPNILSNPYDDNRGLWFADYMTRNCLVENADLQNLGTGIITPMNSDTQGATGPTAGLFTIENSHLANVVNIEVPPPSCVNGSSDLAPIQVIVNNVTFAHPNVNRTFDNIVMDDSSGGGAYGSPNLSLLQVVYVYNYNGVSGDNFDVYPMRVTNEGNTTLPLFYGYIVSVSSSATAPTWAPE